MRWRVTWRTVSWRLDWHTSVSDADVSDGRRPRWCVCARIVRCRAEDRGHERHQRIEWLTSTQSMNDTRTRWAASSLARLFLRCSNSIRSTFRILAHFAYYGDFGGCHRCDCQVWSTKSDRRKLKTLIAAPSKAHVVVVLWHHLGRQSRSQPL